MPLEGRDRANRLAVMTGLVNGSIFAFLPLVLLVLPVALTPEISDTSTTVRPEGASPLTVVAVGAWLEMWRVLVPLALVASWRTFVHTKRWLTDDDRSWRAVLEAGACGFLYMLLHLGHGIVTQPSQAPPYVVVYGGLALIIGLIVGLVLRTTALLFLRFSRSFVA